MKKRLFQSTMLFSLALLLSGCDLALFDSSGVTGKEIGDTILLTMGLMLIVVIPTILMSIWIPYKYHSSKADESYDPEWEHSSKIEFFAWGVPVVIIVILATITYFTSYSLDPRKELASDKEPLTVQVVAMDWKWLFLYPEEKIAVVNEVAFPVDRPVEFLVTSQSTMNSFFIPKLGGQIYAMAGMENRMNLMGTEIGEYRGISANYSGFGFAGMRFKAKVTSEEDFGKWVESVKASGQVLTDAEYDRLIEKTRDHKVEYFSSIDPLQFKNIIESFIGSQNGSN
ncbi:ubiquinol oxidase subunit II [Marinomonas sp. GJ51-6]|uniref:ubiquinol oxidase subunit II n=1 Tax=Marinomonas sp. GJ51-6 TaxID=2992802 RepID=UPI0029352D44|nr:ubiquinol oxidase subunit II [Marinomonas sp. GJ51-6]WOD08983.1 ubiquinol oxidase subunit II [Marinomonas sp. GJ51-6]